MKIYGLSAFDHNEIRSFNIAVTDTELDEKKNRYAYAGIEITGIKEFAPQPDSSEIDYYYDGHSMWYINPSRYNFPQSCRRLHDA